jgi:crotonobetainyl-CoA:carnitine CoA-transferase CaiB-like acyl-CoA transferase
MPMNNALSHVTVLDLSRVLAGPWAGQVLADFGAQVIKVERPATGDDTRSWGPPFMRDAAGHENAKADAAYFLCANRNKKSLTVDFTTPEGRDIVRRLACSADVVLENFKVGSLAAYGLDYTSLKALNPRLIYCSITGFGQTGPYAARPGYDFLVQAMGGLMSITGRGVDEAGAGPQKAGVAVTDILTGLYAVIGILTALTHRDRTGQGQHIDLSLLDVQVACLANQAMNYLISGAVPQRLGNAHPNIVPYQDFPTGDGYMIIAVGNDPQFAKLCAEMQLGGLAQDPRFATNKNRVINRAALIERLCEVTRTRSTAQWVAALESAGVPCGPINSIDAVFADPQVQARAMRIDLPHPLSGTVPLVANPLHLSQTPATYRSAPPTLGEHTREVLIERLGLSTAEVDRLSAAGVI